MLLLAACLRNGRLLGLCLSPAVSSLLSAPYQQRITLTLRLPDCLLGVCSHTHDKQGHSSSSRTLMRALHPPAECLTVNRLVNGACYQASIRRALCVMSAFTLLCCHALTPSTSQQHSTITLRLLDANTAFIPAR